MAAWPAHAAIAVAQPAMSCEAQGATTCTTTGVTTTNGNLFVASTSYCCDTFTSITDSKLNTYTNAVPDQADTLGGTVRQDYKASGSGGASHTFTVTGGSTAFFATLSVIEVSGAAASSPLDQIKGNSDAIGTTSHTSTSTAATAQANELLIGAGGGISIMTYTTDTGAGWTEQTNVATDLDSEGILVGTKIVSAIGTYEYTYTVSPGHEGASVISTWKEAAASTRQRCIGCGTDKKVIGE